jgi:hypothetical protein
MQSHKPDIRLNICQHIHQTLTPIEHKWAQVKAIRKQQNQTVEQLFKIESFYVT